MFFVLGILEIYQEESMYRHHTDFFFVVKGERKKSCLRGNKSVLTFV